MSETILYDNQLLMYIKLFERLTKTKVKDCFPFKEKLIFVVEYGQAKRAVGKSGETMKKVEEKIGKRLKIVEFNRDKLTFIKNLILPFKMNLKEEEDTIVIEGDDVKAKGLLIGAKAQNLRNMEKIVRRYFPDVKEIKVI